MSLLAICVSSLDNCPFKSFVPLKSLFRVRTLLEVADTAGVNVHKTGDVQGSLRSPRTRTRLAPDRPWNWVVEALVRADQQESGTGSSHVSVLRVSVPPCCLVRKGSPADQNILESLGAKSPWLTGEGMAPRSHASVLCPSARGVCFLCRSQLYRPGVQSRLHWNRAAA